MTTKQIKQSLRDGPHAWPGGYPKFFITSDGAALSHEAVRAEWRQVCDAVRHTSNDGWRVVAEDVNWEDPDLYCDHTGNRIESAYAEDREDPDDMRLDEDEIDEDAEESED